MTFNLEGIGKSTSSFAYSFAFLPAKQREAMRTVYAFCRSTDDIVDSNAEYSRKLTSLDAWRSELGKAISGSSEFGLLNRLCRLAHHFNIPIGLFYDLIRGVEMDLTKNRYESFEELKEYCYLVASTVGLMSLQIFGAKDDSAKDYAIDLGIALQLTNIIRDVGADARAGRIYIPLEDMRRFRYSEDDLLASRYTAEFRALMEYEASRADEFFAAARTHVAGKDRHALFAAKIMERTYYHTLIKIRRLKFNVFDEAIAIPKTLRLFIALKYWLRDRVLS